MGNCSSQGKNWECTLPTPHWLIPVLLLTLIVFSTGCLEKGCHVSGSILANELPLESGEIAFRPVNTESDSRVVQLPIVAGKFHTQDQLLTPGTYRIEIQGRRKTGRKIPSEEGVANSGDEWEEFIPPQFNVQSKLLKEVIGNQEDMDFDLKF